VNAPESHIHANGDSLPKGENVSISAKVARRVAVALLLGAASLSVVVAADNGGTEPLRADSTWGVTGPSAPAAVGAGQAERIAAPMDSTWG
jgi:hypothetical protein